MSSLFRRWLVRFGCCAAMVTDSANELSDFFTDAGVSSIQNDRVDCWGKTDGIPCHHVQHKCILVFRWDHGSCDQRDHDGRDVRDEERGIHVNGGPQGLPLSLDLFPLLFGQLHLLLLGDDLVLVSVSDLDQDSRAHYGHQETDSSESGGQDLASLEGRSPHNAQDQAQHEPHKNGWGEKCRRCYPLCVPVRSQDCDSPFQAHQHLADKRARASNSEHDLSSLQCCTKGHLQYQVLNLFGEDQRLQECADQ